MSGSQISIGLNIFFLWPVKLEPSLCWLRTRQVMVYAWTVVLCEIVSIYIYIACEHFLKMHKKKLLSFINTKMCIFVFIHTHIHYRHENKCSLNKFLSIFDLQRYHWISLSKSYISRFFFVESIYDFSRWSITAAL